MKRLKLFMSAVPLTWIRRFAMVRADYVQQQGPFPQQLEADGVGHIVAQVGPKVGPCAFSSLAAKPEWLASDMAEAFIRAYVETPPLYERSCGGGDCRRTGIVFSSD